jgi:hypothetical protein
VYEGIYPSLHFQNKYSRCEFQGRSGLTLVKYKIAFTRDKDFFVLFSSRMEKSLAEYEKWRNRQPFKHPLNGVEGDA